MQKRLHLLFAVMMFFVSAAMAQVTTSGISGKVTSQGESVIGATVTATHKPSGTVYRAVTNMDGRYTIQGMRPGGPYNVEISYIGYQPKTFQNVSLSLGESQNLSCTLQEDSHLLDEVVVAGKAGLNGSKTGAAQSINSQMIQDMPSISHSIADVARMNPQLATNGQSGAMSFAGTNNRYNSFQIDGVMNNDVFGLTSNGSNGGQSGTQPVSMETIDQVQINVAPFDVRQGGFTGGAINAITKSGTNEFHGSAYFDGNNQELVGRHYKKLDGTYADPYDKEKEIRAGFTLGGPIVKNKLFFFANYEYSNKTYPTQYGFGSTGAKFDSDVAQNLLDRLVQYGLSDEYKAKYGSNYEYHPSWSNEDKYVRSHKGGVKLDWNINDFNKFSFRWSLVDARQLNGLGSMSVLNTTDHLYEFHSKTNSFSAELQSRISPVLSNEARLSYVRVRDSRSSGAAAPSITIYNVGSGTVNIGNEYSSMANSLDQDIYSVEDNFTWLHGNHTFTFGTHNEFYRFSNLFIQNLYGCYYFDSPADFNGYIDSFYAGQPDGSKIKNFYYTTANTAVTGTPLWAPTFGAGQLAFYAQDKWDITTSFQLTYGLRVDIPLFFDTPTENPTFNNWAAAEGYSYTTNHKLSSAPMWSPRVGFRWDINKDHKYILRGGVGVFTGRIPFVWLSNNFTNTGVQFSSYSSSNNKGTTLELLIDPNQQGANAQKLNASGSQLVNVFDKNFKFAQNLRLNLGFDFRALGIDWTAEAIFSKNLNDVYYKNIAYEETGETLGQTTYMYWDNRPVFQKVKSASSFSNIYAMHNTSKGYSYNLSLSGTKHFDFGLDLSASYTYTKSKSICSAISSVAQSNWRNNSTRFSSNEPELSNSAFNVPHLVKASAFYHINYGPKKLFTTTIGIIYQGQSGAPYSLYYNGDLNGDGASNDLIFIPTDEQIDKMTFTPIMMSDNKTVKYSQDQQRANLKKWLAGTAYLNEHRGEYYERYADNLPFESHFDFHFGQKFGIKVGKYVHSLEVTMDILNVANLLNKKWGHTYGSSYNSELVTPITYKGNGAFQFDNDSTTPIKYYSDYYSRWRGQIGVKYTF